MATQGVDAPPKRKSFRSKLSSLELLFPKSTAKREADHTPDEWEIGDDFGLQSVSITRVHDPCLFLGSYSESDVWALLKKHGVEQKIRAAGYTNLVLKFDNSDMFVSRFQLFFDEPVESNLLIDFIARRMSATVRDLKAYADEPEGLYDSPQDHAIACDVMQRLRQPIEITAVEWLLLQNPRKPFDRTRPSLPGQRYPGLGVMREFNDMIMDAGISHDLHYIQMTLSRTLAETLF
mmetsp:Transcript_6814/g.10675  ORF Transcript_6814/g.10675 Transcript_6814/m.10675 type:complete len:235 (+) Transcript_6814:119-823(+)